LEAGVRTRIRSFIEELLEAELEAALSRKRPCIRSAPALPGRGATAEAVAGEVLILEMGPQRRTRGTVGSLPDSANLAYECIAPDLHRRSDRL
jgi:hypothetical protein